MLEINQLFKDLAIKLKEAPEVNGTKELLNEKFILNDLDHNMLTLSCRHKAMIYAVGELIWYWSGRNDINFIDHFSKFWRNISDDGVTANSAYGYIIKKKHGFDQLECVIDELRRNPNSRRGVININTPDRYRMVTRDTQCTMFLHYYIRDNKLCSTVCMRSNDLIKGLTFDIVYFTELQKYVAHRLGLECGSYTHFDTSLHVYERDYELLDKIINDNNEIDVEYNFKELWNDDNLNYLQGIVDNCWKSKEEFSKICEDLGIILY